MLKLLHSVTAGGMEMPLYIMFTRLSSDGRKTIMNNPSRAFEVNKEVEEMGAKVIAQYALLGNYDFINILEAQSNEVIARVAAQLGSRGTMEPITMAAISMQDYVRELETAKIISK
jgi:uncharacterized protein with GYD domain